MRTLPVIVLITSLTATTLAQTREQTVRNDRQRVEAEGFWIYNDLPRAFEEAKRTGKPIVVVLRCLPCHECVKLDDNLVERDPLIRILLSQFVCVRQVSTNGLDLGLFQYDTDQSFAVFFLNVDKTIYGRFGTRSHRTEWASDVSLDGLAKALEGALDLHKEYASVKASLAGKRGQPMEFATPEQYPSLKRRYTSQLDWKGNVVKSCIHCHQIGDAQREYYWRAGKPIPDKVLWPYPHPKSLGLIMDPNEMATVKEVHADSPAATAGLRTGDAIESFNGQPMLSLADIQWVLHNADPAGARLPMKIRRAGRTLNLTLTLAKDWRRKGEITWRVSTWGLRRMATGGLLLETASESQRRSLRLSPKAMALRIKHVGKYGAHAAAGKAGFREGDILVEFDGRRDLHTEQDALTYVVTTRKPGDRVPVTLIRNGKTLNLRLPIQP